MNGRIAKKIRRQHRRQFLGYLADIKSWPLRDRLWFAWHVVFTAWGKQ